MAKTYSQLLQNIEDLKRQAEDRRKQEIKGVVDRIREAIRFYGLTPADLGLAGASRGAAKAGRPSRGAANAMYRDAAGNTWSGRGPRPRWLKEALARGQTLEELRGGGVSEAAPAKRGGRRGAGKKAAGGRPVKYRDASGNTWGGMGKRPQWLRDALAGGKNLEDFRVESGGSAT